VFSTKALIRSFMSFKSSLTIEKGFASAWTSATAAAARRGVQRLKVTGPRSARAAVASMTIAHRIRGAGVA